jgi:hypothetical protein
VLAVLLGGPPVFGQEICTIGDGHWVEKLCYSNIADAPTYGHSILGDTPEWDEMTVFYGPKGQAAAKRSANTTRSPNHIFEDTAPRLTDITGDGQPEAVVVETDFAKGARIAVYQLSPSLKRIAATPYIGQKFRWYAPVGTADFNGDGHMDIAFVDRPHLAKILRVWTYKNGKLSEIAAIGGVTNHQIGEAYFTSSIRTCNGQLEMVLTDAARQNIIAVFFNNGVLGYKSLGRFKGARSVTTPPACN